MVDPIGFRSLYTRRLWEQFVQGKKIARDALPEYVYKSWQRCKKNGLGHRDIPNPKRLGPKELDALRQDYGDILEIAKPVLNMIKISTRETNPIVILTSLNGTILHVVGDETSLSAQEVFYNTPGVVWDDAIMGSRATTLALQEKKPISLCGSEHYLEIFHESLCYAAPVFNHKNEIVASISIATSLKNYHPHTMAMLTAAAESISLQLQKKDSDRKKNYLSSLVYSICNALPECIVALDMNGTITYVNNAVETVFARPDADLLGQKITEVIHESSREDLLRALALRKQNNLTLHIQGKSADSKYLCRLQPLFSDGKASLGMTLFLASDKQVLKGITHIGGNRAYYRFEDILGESQEIQHCIKLARRIARKATRVLLTGESGTGKELFAQAIHNAGPRCSGPFVAISCASIPRELVEAELFGYVSGAFTGASKGGAIGKFELAQNGTLFLDEINSLPLEAQGKLLRTLQQNEVLRVGGTTPIPVNAHVITASNVNLADLAASKMFREDLLYRVNSVEIYIPPLRARGRDVERLVRDFISRHAASQNRRILISPCWLDLMLQHSWPGNVRELENACEYSMLVCEGDTLYAEHAPPSVRGGVEQQEQPIILCEQFEEAYKKWLTTALDACQGSITKASEKLGLSRSTLHRKIKKFALDSRSYRKQG